MSTLLLWSMGAFGASVFFASIVNAWRQQFTDAWNASPMETLSGHPSISVVVAVRNGASTLGALLQDLHAQNYPVDRMEVIVVDDASEDATWKIAQGMTSQWVRLRVVKSEGIGKKAAIERGVQEAQGEWILLTDADVRCGAMRSERLAQAVVQQKADLFLLPVITEGSDGALARVQEDEQAAMLGVTAATAWMGAPVLANGANMAFRKLAFEAVGGFRGDRFTSGDDLFLMQRMRTAGMHVGYVGGVEAAVITQAETKVGAFWQQRLRWAGKMRGVPGAAKWMGALVLAYPFMLLMATCCAPFDEAVGHGIFRATALLAAAWLLWIMPVIALVNAVERATGRRTNSLGTACSFLLFSLYSPCIAVIALFVRPRWKGRRI